MEDKRLLLAVMLSLGILLVWQFLFVEPPEDVPVEDEETEEEAEADGDDDAETPDGETPEGDTPVEVKSDIEPAVAVLETDHYSLSLTNVGGRGLHYVLKLPERYQEHDDFFKGLKPEDDDAPPEALPFETQISDVDLDGESMFEIIETPQGETGVWMRWVSADGLTTVEKRFKPGDSDYAVNLEVLVSNRANRALDDDLVMVLHGRQAEEDRPSLFSPRQPISATCFTDEDVERVEFEDDPESFTTGVKWVTVDEQYFAVAAVLESATQCRLSGGEDGRVVAALDSTLEVEAGKETLVAYELYLGPKEGAALEGFGNDLEMTVDYGWVEFLARPIRWLLMQLQGMVGNWGIAIIILTIIIRSVLWPITRRSQESMMAMKDLQPEIKKLQEKYKNDPTLLQQKQMALFKEHGVNPLGCLPLFLQIPIWFALYRTIYVSAELYLADFGLWIHDLSAPDPYYVLPLLGGGMMLLQQRFTTSTVDTKQRVMMIGMMGLFVVVMFFLPSGLNLYIMVSGFIGLLQSLHIKRMKDAKDAEKKGSAASGDKGGDNDKKGDLNRAARRRKQRS